ncbi:hypothetical protein [Cryptosporangium aurantiacum]|uniref:Uncharacterized protein n=1 Tax=Cryptosporangium aurantiacum TaxID=134849 RepID=A0A1M7QUG1_9ACTN|nr:hypothetical protein [Cryptosporangium aurantiacum]SHN35276.1 hypothetical protein SAMN05443668_105375 [Cryptosporangium aurantiacum]
MALRPERLGRRYWLLYLELRERHEREIDDFLCEVEEDKRAEQKRRGTRLRWDFKGLRDAQGLTQLALVKRMLQLAAERGISMPDEDNLKVYVSRWENKHTRPTRPEYIELLEAILLPDASAPRPALRAVPAE